ncbi:MAG: hypothetical protein QCI82_04690 [Candidatus Thermoplasmatota archaeon]|nr:hypothetical protein [Candidatus Thermoplasmatota archaeon]
MDAQSRKRSNEDGTLRVLCAGEVPSKIPPLLQKIARVMDDPHSLPMMVEEIVEDTEIEKYRYHLVRMQIESEIRMREDVDRHSNRLWVARTLETIAFGERLMDGGKEDEE